MEEAAQRIESRLEARLKRLAAFVKKWWLAAIAIAFLAGLLWDVGEGAKSEIKQQFDHVLLAFACSLGFGCLKLIVMVTLFRRWLWFDEFTEDAPQVAPATRLLPMAIMNGLIFVGFAIDFYAIMAYLDH